MKNIFLFAVLFVSLSNYAFAGLDKYSHLKNANSKLENALRDLAGATNGKKDFGGHKEKAEDLIRQAMAELKQGSEYADLNAAATKSKGSKPVSGKKP